MNTFKAIIIDDENDARETLSTILRDFCPEIELIGTAADLPSGIKLIYKTKPHVVFLDIEMPEYNGLEILNFIEPELLRFDIIFTTAYSEYAIQAFKLSAVDYLLKPIQIEQLQLAVKKLRPSPEFDEISSRFEALKQNLNTSTGTVRVALPVTDGLLFINSDRIMFIKADRSYSEFVLADGNRIVVSKNLKEFEYLLNRSTFYRPHRSYMINFDYLRQFVRKDGGYLLMESGDEIPISNEKREELVQIMQRK
jgi:two-component system, LytTR family, response regulator